MLLVAITGPVGSAKTALLRDFARFAQDQGHKVDGFVSLAGLRRDFNQGAESYTLYWVKTEKRQLFAKRDEDFRFQIEPQALADVDQWSRSLTAKLDLVVMDEFGKWEAEGNGLMPYWPAVQAANPRVMVVTLREGCRTQIEEKLGRKFNRVLDAEAVDTPSQLRTLFSELRDWEFVGTYGASSGGLECSLGTYLHAFRFPFVGTVMGSLQAAVLAMASKNMGQKELIVWISTISAGFKAMSPAGTRISPMVAIVAQGLLFTIGATIGRWTKLGFVLGAFLVGIWSALQGFFIQYLLLGRPLERAWGFGATYVRQKIGLDVPNIWVAVLLLCILNGAASVGLTLVILSRSHRLPEKAPATPGKHGSVLFWLPLVIVGVVLLIAGEQPNSVLWMVLRAVAVCLSLYGLARLATRINFAGVLSKLGLWGPSHAIQVAKDKKSL